MKRFLISLFALALCCVSVSAQQSKRQLMKKLDRVYQLIENIYVEDTPLEPLAEEAIRATLKSLDPHSQYLTKEEMELSKRHLKGKFAGIGIKYIIHNDTLVVSSVIANSPAEQAHIEPNDRIVAVDDRSIVGSDLATIKSLMSGKAGSHVTLTLLPASSNTPTRLKLRRENIQNTTVVALRIDSIGYISISTFSKPLASEFYQAYRELGDVKGLVIDLRDNGGGYLTSALDLTSLFLAKGDVELITESKRREVVYDCKRDGLLKDIPLVVIINENSASASEIFAGAIQDHDRGIIVGRTSFGKGLIQRNIEYKDGSGIRITTARYKTPSGRPIQRPYIKGQNQAYHSDSLRFLHPDSISRDSAQIYTTLKLGRKVYADGGITPDVYISTDSLKLSKEVAESLSNAIIEHSIIEFWNPTIATHIRECYPTAQQFAEEYTIDTQLWDILFRRANYTSESITHYEYNYLKTMLYMALAQRLYGIEAGYYINISRIDYTAQRAIAIAADGYSIGTI